jgi:hypothetical protein
MLRGAKASDGRSHTILFRRQGHRVGFLSPRPEHHRETARAPRRAGIRNLDPGDRRSASIRCAASGRSRGSTVAWDPALRRQTRRLEVVRRSLPRHVPSLLMRRISGLLRLDLLQHGRQPLVVDDRAGLHRLDNIRKTIGQLLGGAAVLIVLGLRICNSSSSNERPTNC